MKELKLYYSLHLKTNQNITFVYLYQEENIL